MGSVLAAPVPAPPVVPPVPVSAGSTPSTAALASGPVPQLLTGGTDLRIGSAPAWQGQGAGTGATLRPPDPITQPVSRARGVASNVRLTSYEQALSALAARGVKWRRLETVGETNESKFSCSIPNAQNQFISRTYEARAAGDLAAIQAVLDQIEKEGSDGRQ